MSDPAPPHSFRASALPTRSEPPPWFLPSISWGVGVLLGIILGFFIGHCAGESSGFGQAEEKIAQLTRERDEAVGQAQGDVKKERGAREAAENLSRELQAKVLVGRSIELCLQAVRGLKGSNFGFVGRDLIHARESLFSAISVIPPGVVKVQLQALHDAFDPVLTLVLKLSKKDLIEKAIEGLLTELRGARDKIAPPPAAAPE